MKSILWIDDESLVNDLGVLLLKKLGYKARALYGGVEALSIFKARPHAFDLVITDYMMPDMTGDELTRRIREVRPDIPVVLCTGYADLPAAVLTKWGIDALLPKPYSIDATTRLVRNLLKESGQNHKKGAGPRNDLARGLPLKPPSKKSNQSCRENGLPAEQLYEEIQARAVPILKKLRDGLDPGQTMPRLKA